MAALLCGCVHGFGGNGLCKAVCRRTAFDHFERDKANVQMNGIGQELINIHIYSQGNLKESLRYCNSNWYLDLEIYITIMI